MVAPLIGITTSVTVDTIPERAYLNGTYIRAVQAAGGIPLLLTPHFTPEVQAALWQRLDGLVLTGGDGGECLLLSAAEPSGAALFLPSPGLYRSLLDPAATPPPGVTPRELLGYGEWPGDLQITVDLLPI